MVNRQVGKSRAEREPRDRGVFKYKPRSAEQLKARAQNRGGQFDSIFKQGVDTWRPSAGENNIRILWPSWDGHDNYGYSAFVHYSVGVTKSSYLCLELNKKLGTDKPIGKRCPVCDAWRKAKKAGDDDEAQQLRATERVLCWIIDRDGNERTPLMFSMPQTMDAEINDRCYDAKSGKTIMVDDPDEGRDITIKRKGEGLNTKYMITIDMEPSPVSENSKTYKVLEEFVSENPIPSLLNFYDPAYLDKVMSGTASEKDEDLDEDEDTSDDHDHEEEEARTSMKAKGRRAAADDEDEDDEPPARRAKPSRSRDEDEDDDTPPRRMSKDEDDEDEDDDEPPARRVKPKRAAARDGDDEDEDELPSRSTRKSKRDEDDDEDEDDDPPPRKAKRRDDDEDEDDEPPKRERVKRRRSDEDDDDED